MKISLQGAVLTIGFSTLIKSNAVYFAVLSDSMNGCSVVSLRVQKTVSRIKI